jgi:hypothetical protein
MQQFIETGICKPCRTVRHRAHLACRAAAPLRSHEPQTSIEPSSLLYSPPPEPVSINSTS